MSKLDVEAAVKQAGGKNGVARIHLEQLKLDEVLYALQKLKPKKSTGPDGIPPYIFKDCRLVIGKPLLYIFNQCLAEAVFPDRWKTTKVVPVPKGKSASNVNQYRPVAVLSTPAKVLEAAVHKSILSQVNVQLSDEQHGFRLDRSTTSNLINYMNYIVPEVDAGGQVEVAFVDYKKAFDLVDNTYCSQKWQV
ncbi:unnamed protein product [Parnassius apollo]|uniref:(apollo) hypothetical protein n=1 Tax=Parnassius apollo TaxID=110799 RepID=A0A8S3WIB7_PARAO|nr:unnamed protein product [Parnassius apollo]